MLSSSKRESYVGTQRSRSLTYGALAFKVCLCTQQISPKPFWWLPPLSHLILRHRFVLPGAFPALALGSIFSFQILCVGERSELLMFSFLMSIGPSVIAWIEINKWVIHQHHFLARHISCPLWFWCLPQPFLVSSGSTGRPWGLYTSRSTQFPQSSWQFSFLPLILSAVIPAGHSQP